MRYAYHMGVYGVQDIPYVLLADDVVSGQLGNIRIGDHNNVYKNTQCYAAGRAVNGYIYKY